MKKDFRPSKVSLNILPYFEAFFVQFFAPSYVSAWRQNFVQKMHAKNVDEIDGRCQDFALFIGTVAMAKVTNSRASRHLAITVIILQV